MSGQAQDLDGNGRTALSGLAPGTGYVTPQLGATTGTDSVTGHLYAPSVVQLSSSTVVGQLPAIVQKAHSISTAGVASLTCAFTANNAAGNSIVVVCAVGDGTAATVTDSAGNTYTKAVVGANSTTFSAQIFYAVNIVSGANTITVTPDSSISVGIQIYEVSGLLAQVTTTLGQTSSGSGTGTTASTSAVASSVPNAIAFLGVAVGTAAQAVSKVSGTNWTLDSTANVGGTPSGLFTFGALSQSFGNISATIPQATIAGSEPWAAAAALFKPVALGVEGTVTIGGYNYTRVTTAATTLVKTGPGILHAVAMNKMGASATLELDDALTNTTPIIGIITLPATITSMAPFSVTYDVAFSTGLSATVGTATIDATIIWK